MEVREVALETVLKIRREVMYPEESIDFVKLEEDIIGLHLGLYVNNKLVSVTSVFEKNGAVQFRKFATLIEEQGKGYGTALLQYIFDWAIAEGKRSIWCNARISATALYRKFGMELTGKPWQKYGIEFIKMEKQF